jgi:hypothetical protein
MLRAVAPLLLCLVACGKAKSDRDDFMSMMGADSGTPDAGAVDAGSIVPDAGEVVPDAGPGPDAGMTPAPDAGPVDAGVPRIGPATYPLMLTHGAFPPTGSHPNALVYVPANFDPTPPIDVVVWLHGFYNCIENVVLDVGQPCTSGGSADDAYSLVSQLETSNKNVLLLVPELAFDQASSNPGTLSTQGAFAQLLDETMTDLRPALGQVNLASVGKVIVASHSGGYAAAAGIVGSGGVPVQEVWLFDSLYAYSSTFEAWIYDDVSGIEAVQRRFGTVYTFTGGTNTNSQDMADSVATQLPASAIHDDRTTSTWTLPEFHYGALFKQSALAHNDVPRYYFTKFLQTSTLRDR